MSWFRRKPDVALTVDIPKFDTAAEAMEHHTRFVDLVMKYDLEIDNPVGPQITVRGRPKKVEGFQWEWGVLRELNQI